LFTIPEISRFRDSDSEGEILEEEKNLRNKQKQYKGARGRAEYK
jgi:hypothetical protein